MPRPGFVGETLDWSFVTVAGEGRDRRASVLVDRQYFFQADDIEHMTHVFRRRGQTETASEFRRVTEILEKDSDAGGIDEGDAAEIRDECRTALFYLGQEQRPQGWRVMEVDLTCKVEHIDIRLSGFVQSHLKKVERRPGLTIGRTAQRLIGESPTALHPM